jgi:hypothetical protein
MLVFLNFGVTKAKREADLQAGLLARQKVLRLCFADCAKDQPSSKKEERHIYMYIL